MSNNFVFPPPPPPPPPTTNQTYPSNSYPSQSAHNSSRGRGGFSSGPRGHGSRGGYGGGNQRGGRPAGQSGYSYQQRNGFKDTQPQAQGQFGQQNSWQARNQQYGFLVPNGNSYAASTSSASVAYAGAKRPHDTAFPRKPLPPKVQAAPAVPSFGLSLPVPVVASTLPQVVSAPIVASKKRGLFGLIPPDSEDSESEDEEAKLASAVSKSATEALSFEYKGKLATLRTQEDIAAWIAERRKNFPNKARGEVLARKRAEEKAVADEAKAAAAAKRKAANEEREKALKAKREAADAKRALQTSKAKDEQEKAQKVKSQPVSKEQLKIEKLRKAMEKNARKLAKLEAATNNSVKGEIAEAPQEKDTGASLADSDDDSATISSLSDSEATSSSGSSGDSDSDLDSGMEGNEMPDRTAADLTPEHEPDQPDSDSDAPPETSSIHKSPIRVAAPARGKVDTRPLCRNIKAHGRCTRKFCKFRHKSNEHEGDQQQNPPGKGRKVADQPAPKLSLYQRLLQQQIAEDERAEKEAADKEAQAAPTT